MSYFSKDTLISRLCEIRDLGWVETQRQGNDGGVGNTLEDLLGIKENNLPLPNAGEWEIKGQRAETSSLTTLFHLEPSPRAMRFVPRILLPSYGWPHKDAGEKYPMEEMSFRQTIAAPDRTSRGFTVVVNRDAERIEVSFDATCVDTNQHGEWLRYVSNRIGLAELNPQPYWGFEDLFTKLVPSLTRLCTLLPREREPVEANFSTTQPSLCWRTFNGRDSWMR
jgi:hypothetical protein